MSQRLQVRSLGVRAPGEPAFFSLPGRGPADGEIAVKTLYTGLSAGTELTFVKGTNPYLHAQWDAEYGLFRQDSPSVAYPVRVLGYMEVATVTSSRSPSYAEGQLVAAAYGHRSEHTLDPARDVVVTLPASLDPVLGVFVAQMGPIAANGVLHAAAELADGQLDSLTEALQGRAVLVIGGGVVGLLSALFAAHHGADVALADPDPMRLSAARGLGIQTVDELAQETWQWSKDNWRHGPRDRGADLVLQCRGRVRSLVVALRSLRPQGAVIDLAFYQEEADELQLGEEFHHNGLTLRCAQIARVPRKLAGTWTRARLADETLQLLAAHGEAVRAHVITDVVPLDEAPALITALAARQRSTIQAVFSSQDLKG
jgi:threonine dehydrogenase-like Zn-dependent dehydrogenase